MSSQPTFNYYSELGVDPSASAAEIKAAYHRLALQHHPDKNQANKDDATVKFQRVNEAAEVLMDETRRRNYDARSQGAQHISPTAAAMRAWVWANIVEPSLREQADLEREHEAQVQARARRAAENEAHRKAKEKALRQAQEIEAKRVADEEARRAAKDAAAKAAVEESERRRADEEASQVRAWVLAGAVTDQQKREECLHSEYCAKTVQRRKVRCGCCAVKRGIVAFVCPYCDETLCSLCVQNFTQARKERMEDEDAGRVAESCQTI
ncbi:hypothetical protein GGTG_08726 [Gaeumannomyces tritici R3-111a-1]|uniref:J domain-containing protein n=1 Tax=Gaeumannomyces tritici (strain R3-111a-1) TaxID=644352 RepID=J3P5D7_GAET3|nr:hypothetical protein GGTG_08726 [Gaeumannomyces tritici R3-111a-1]EJT74888.1 hypothetical protein GGTG_08726 [Gaeumannomyces tritici R3-111a-1]